MDGLPSPSSTDVSIKFHAYDVLLHSQCPNWFCGVYIGSNVITWLRVAIVTVSSYSAIICTNMAVRSPLTPRPITLPVQETNPSFVLRAVQDVVFEDRPVPSLKDPWDVRVQVAQTGICGSDVHYWQRGRIGGLLYLVV